MLEAMRQDYVRTARAAGFTRRRVLWLHVLPNALVPIVTIIGMQFAALVTGTIVIENVFYLPGLGRLIFQSIANRDLPTVQALVMLFAAIQSLRFVRLPIFPSTPLIRAIMARKTSNIAATFAASFNPSVVPLEMASRMFDPILSCETLTSVLIPSVCG